MDKKKLLLSFIAFLTALTAHCASFTVDTLTFTTLDDEARTVRLTNVKSQAAELNIPETVVYEGVTYTVTSVDLRFPPIDIKGNSAIFVTMVTVPKTVEEIVNLRGGKAGLQKILFADESRLRTIGTSAFSGCRFEEISLPESVETIGESAFENCSCLTGIDIPGNVTTIKARTFYRCLKLADIKLPAKLEVIEKEAFRSAYKDCPKRSIVLPEGLLSIGEYAFDYAEIHPAGTVPPVLDPNSFGEGVTVVTDNMALLGIYSNADVWSDYIKMEISGDGLTYRVYLDSTAQLVKVPENEIVITVPETISYGTYLFPVTSIEDYVFSSSSEEIYIKARVSTIGSQRLGSLRHIELPASLERIEDDTFHDCNLLESIDIPDNVKYIGNYAFKNCTKLTELPLPATLESIYISAIEGCTAVTELRIPHTIRDIYYLERNFHTVPVTDSLKNIFITGGSNDTYVDIDGVLFRKIKDTDKKELMYYPCGRDAAEYTVPDGTVGILEYAFYRNWNFYDLSYYFPTPLKRINLPESLEYIDDYAFAYNFSLEYINFPKELKSIGEFAFYCDRKLMVRIPETVTYIGDCALDVNTVYIDAIQPPSCDYEPIYHSVVGTLGGGATICVKPEAVDAYKSHKVWSDYRVLSESDVYEADGLIYMANGRSEVELVGSVKLPNGTLDIPQAVTIDGKRCTVTAIGEYALNRAAFVNTINIPETVDSIGYSCFDYSVHLTSVNIGNARIKWPNFYYTTLQEITAGENNVYYTVQDGVLYSKAMDTLMYYPVASRETFFLPESVKVIGDDVIANSISGRITLKNFYSLSQAIPMCGPSSFERIGNVTLYVPENLVSAYGRADGWKNFRMIVGLSDEEISGVLAGVDGVKTDNRVRTADDGVFYTLSGQRVTTPGKGIYIRNGKKVVVR